MPPVRILTSLFAVCALTLSACSSDPFDSSDDADETEPQGGTDSALTSAVDCNVRTDTGYVSGSPRQVKLITIGGKPMTIAVGHQFIKMQKAANAAGVNLSVNSGFRTMAEQQHLYSCYIHKNCNNGNLAARPGYSNHQSGYALDLTTSTWLANNAGRFGFRRTVPSEAWHYEYNGPDTGGPCSAGGGGGNVPAPPPPAAGGGNVDPPANAVTCKSATLGRNVPPGTCVQRADDGLWYLCDADAPGDWPQIDGPDDPSCTSCPQQAGGQCN
jgi:hypothetical protein